MEPQSKTRRKRTNVVFSVLTAALISGIIIRIFLFDSFFVVGNSMAPAIVDGDYVFVNKLAYQNAEPAREDIVVGNFREMPGKKVIKRVVGLPREWISIEDNQLTITGSRGGEVVATRELYTDTLAAHAAATSTRYRLDPFEYYLIGDNGLSSIDSRELGPVDNYQIDGKVVMKFDFTTFKLSTY